MAAARAAPGAGPQRRAWPDALGGIDLDRRGRSLGGGLLIKRVRRFRRPSGDSSSDHRERVSAAGHFVLRAVGHYLGSSAAGTPEPGAAGHPGSRASRVRHGRLLLGYNADDPLTVPTMPMVLNRLHVLANPSGSPRDLRDTLAFAAAHQILPEVIPVKLGQAPETLAAMAAGNAPGPRRVITF